MATIVEDAQVDGADTPAADGGKVWPVVSFLARFIMAGVWIIAGGLKYGKNMENILSVQAYQLVPDQVAFAIGTWLPTLEIALGVLLLIGLFLRPAGVISALLQVVFIIGIVSAWARGLQIDCGCFGSGGVDTTVTGVDYAVEIVRDVFFLILSGITVIRPWKKLAFFP